MTISEIIARIEDASDRLGLAPATVTFRAVNNSRLYARLKSGGGCGIDTAQRLQAWIDEQSRHLEPPVAPQEAAE